MTSERRDADTALVTGASRGLGAATAITLASAGFRVAVHYRNHREEAEALLARLPGTGHVLIRADLADPAAARSVFDSAEAELGHVDVLVNNAGLWRAHPPIGTGYGEWQDAWTETIQANLVASANLAWAMAQHLVSRPQGPEGGRIIFVGSRGAYRGEPEAPAYGAVKAGVHALAQSLAVALGGHGIGVFAVAPGVIGTELTAPLLEGRLGEEIRAQSPFGREGYADEVASAIGWLATPKALWASGTVIDLNGASYLR